MNIKEIVKKHAYSCCLNWLLLVGILETLNYYYKLNVKDVLVLLITLIWSILLRSFDQNKKNVIPYIIIVFVGIIMYIICKITKFSALTEVKKYIKWLQHILIQGSSDSVIYSLLTIFIFLIIVSIPCYLLLKQFRLRVIAAVIVFGTLIFATVIKLEISKLSVSFFLTYVLLLLIEGRLKLYYKASPDKSINVMTFLLPFALLMIVAILLLPAKKEPIQWEFFKKCWNGVVSMVEELGSSFELFLHPEKAEFSLNFSGYSEEGDVGGSIEYDDSIAMTVEANPILSSNVYLTGNIKNEFDGKKWSLKSDEATYLEEMDEFVLDLYEFAYALQREGVTQQTYSNYYKLRGINIKYEDLVTKALFHPSKISTVKNNQSDNSFTSKTANLRLNEVSDEDTRYKFDYAQLNLGSEYFEKLIMNQAKFSYQLGNEFSIVDFRKYLKSIYIQNSAKIPENLEALLLQRSDYIRENYTSVYESLPPRVFELVKEITKGYESEYEKLKAIEAYLSSYTYTTTPSMPAEGQDLIDYMLFESREGYCTYYATAFAVMARCIGIPTRYVQGFCVEFANQPDRYKLLVSNRDAHAWADAYIEGIGWLSFEPTPSYGDKFYNPWSSSTTYTVSTYTPTGPVIDEEALDTKLEKQVVELQSNERKIAYQSIILVLIFILILTLIAVPLYLLLKQVNRNRQYKRELTNQKVYMDVNLILSVFFYCERKIEKGETFCSYLDYMRTRYLNQEMNLNYLEQIFLRLRYNEEELQLEEQKAVEKIREDILKEVQTQLNKGKYLRMRIHILQEGQMKV